MAKRKHNNNGNREYKSDVFSMLMQDKKNALEVFNVLNHSDYDNPDELIIITTAHGIFVSIRNDASLLIDNHVSYYEHQSSYCPNMPLRCLIYYMNDIGEYIDFDENNLYGYKKISLPTPHFVVLYNGLSKRPEIETLRLSDSFYHKTDNPELEVVCTTYNINPSFNEEIKEKSKVLFGYTTFVEKVRKYTEIFEEIKAAIKKAIDECIEEDILKEFFLARREEIEDMKELDYSFEKRLYFATKEGREEGKVQAIISLVKDGTITSAVAAQKLGVSEEEVLSLAKQEFIEPE